MLEVSHPRLARTLGLIAVLLMPLMSYFAIRAQQTNTNNVRDWLPKRFEATQQLRWYVERFGTDEILVVSWPGCHINDPRLDQLASLLNAPQPTSSGEARILFRDVQTGRSILNQMTQPPLNLSEDEARRRLTGWLVGPDQTTCAVAMISLGPDGKYDRHAAVRAAERSLEAIGIASSDWRIAGPTADAVAIDRAGTSRVQLLGGIAAIWGALLAWLCLRNGLKALVVFAVAAMGWAASLSVVYLSGENMDAVLMTMPALVFVLAVSGAVHLTHYHQHAQLECDPTTAVRVALRNGWLPCFLACATTAVGLASLAISAVTPVVRFGVFSSIGTVLAFIVLLSFWPAFTHLSSRWHRPTEIASRRAWWDGIEFQSTSHFRLVLAATALVFPALAWGVSNLETSVKLNSLLPPTDPLIRSYAWMQKSIGPIVPMEVVLEFPSQSASRREMLNRARLIENLRARISELPATGGTLSATTFAPKLPDAKGARQVAIRRIVANKLASNRDLFERLRFIRTYRDTELWRITTHVPTGGSVDYGNTIDEMKMLVASVVGESESFVLAGTPDLSDQGELQGAETWSTPDAAPVRSESTAARTATASAGDDAPRPDPKTGPESISYLISGGVPLIYMAQQQLMNDLRTSFLTAFALIGLVMTLLLRSVAGGLLAMIPNVIPSLLVFGVMGLRKFPVDIGTMMTASVALGIAVDDTLHFLIWFRRGMAEYGERRRAVRFAFQNSATAMLHTSLICGLGMIPLVFSPFQPIARFAGVLCALLFSALVGDLVFLPALLVSPLGKFVSPKAEDPSPAVPASTTA